MKKVKKPTLEQRVKSLEDGEQYAASFAMTHCQELSATQAKVRRMDFWLWFLIGAIIGLAIRVASLEKRVG